MTNQHPGKPLKDIVREELIKYQDDEKNMSALARKAGVSRPFLYAVIDESRWKNPGLDIVLRLSNALDIPNDAAYSGVMQNPTRAKKVVSVEEDCPSGLDDFLEVMGRGMDSPDVKKLLAELAYIRERGQ